jgi:hypothetical protein
MNRIGRSGSSEVGAASDLDYPVLLARDLGLREADRQERTRAEIAEVKDVDRAQQDGQHARAGN